MTREEREKAAWDVVNRNAYCGESPECLDGAELVQLRDALNHRIRELGVEDPLEKDIGAQCTRSWLAGYRECEADNDIREDS